MKHKKHDSKKHYSLIAVLIFQMIAMLGASASAVPNQYSATVRQTDQLVGRIETRWNMFRTSFDSAIERSRFNNTEAERIVRDDMASFHWA